MTKRFVLVLLIAFVLPMLVPNVASAQTQNKLVFEIKNVAEYLNSNLNGNDEQKVETPAPVAETAPVIEKPVAKKTYSTLPPKTTGDARVYMHEPEIRAYVCPKLGDKCNIFIAVLKAENGTHECTRDNRGLNRNGSVDIGLAQINWRPGNPWHTFENLQDCKYNLDVALEMYKRRGFQPWYAYTKGAYKKHLPAVIASAKTIQTTPDEVAINVTEPTTITSN
jgi:hypothetical protein